MDLTNAESTLYVQCIQITFTICISCNKLRLECLSGSVLVFHASFSTILHCFSSTLMHSTFHYSTYRLSNFTLVHTCFRILFFMYPYQAYKKFSYPPPPYPTIPLLFLPSHHSTTSKLEAIVLNRIMHGATIAWSGF